MSSEKPLSLHSVILALSMAMLIMTGGGAWFYHNQQETLRQAAIDQLVAIGHLKQEQIAAWRKERLSDAAVLAESPFFKEAVARCMDDPNEENVQPLLAQWRSMQSHYHYADVWLVAPDGQVVLTLVGKPAFHAAYLEALAEAFQERKPVLTELHDEEGHMEPHISAVAPVFAGEKIGAMPLGAVVLICNASQFLFPIIQSWPTPSTTAETLLIRRDGEEVLFLNELRHQSDTALKLRIPLSRTEVPAVRAVLGQEGVFEGTDYRRVKTVSVIFSIPKSPWFIVAKQDAAEIFSLWNFRSGLILGLIFALLSMLVLVALFLWQRNEKARYRTLYHTESRLRAIMERHSITLNAIGDAVIATDVQGRVELLNPIAETLTGWSHDEALGKPIEEVFRIINEETREIPENPVVKVLRDGRGTHLANHTLLISKDGTERPIADSAAPIHDRQNRTNGVVLVFRDQTAEQSAMASLRAERDRAQTYLDVAGVMFVALDQNGTVCLINKKGCGILGLDMNDILGKNWFKQFIPKSEATEVEDLFNTIIAGENGLAGFYENHIIAADGTERLIEWHNALLYDAEGNVIGTLSSGEDITQHKKDEEERDRMLAAIEQGAEIIIITDSDGAIQYVNRAFEQVTGYVREEVLGQNPRILKSGRQDEAFYRDMYATLMRGEVFRGRMVNKRKDGALFTEESTISPIRDASGQIINFVAVKQDITTQLHLEAQLRQAQKMESVGRLAGGVAHDFNNMLAVILGYTELALDQVNADDPLYSDLQEIYGAASRSADVTRQLLAFARRQTIAPKVLDLNETVEGMLKMLRRLIGENVELAWLPQTGLGPVKMDPSQLDQILANLCVNARDAIGGVGKITIETGATTFDEEYCASHAGFEVGEFVLLAVSDNGCGMAPQTLEHLFEPFFTTKGVGEGAGLGLATIYGIVKQNKGFVNVYSEPGQGSTFKIYLPRHTGDGAAIRKERTVSAPSGQGETILIVEDEAVLLKMGVLMLKRLGYNVLAAASPKEALCLVESHSGPIQMLMTDVVMPEMNGHELAQRLRALDPNLKLLFMSGYTANVIAHQGVLDEGVQFIQKPFSIADLAAKLRDALT